MRVYCRNLKVSKLFGEIFRRTERSGRSTRATAGEKGRRAMRTGGRSSGLNEDAGAGRRRGRTEKRKRGESGLRQTGGIIDAKMRRH